MIPNRGKVLLKRKKNVQAEEKQKEDEYKSQEENAKIEQNIYNNNFNQYNDNKIIIENNEENENLQKNINTINKSNNNFESRNLPRISEGVEIPEFLLRPENDHYFQSYMRMRQRNITDGAIIINLENDDLANNRVDLYDNKGINITNPILNENLASNVDYFIENINRDKFVKIPKQSVIKMQRMEKNQEEKKKHTKNATKEEKIRPNIDQNVDIHLLTEDEMFDKFDKKLTEAINKTANKISLLFIIFQGLLSGISLGNLLFLYQGTDFSTFINIYSAFVREMFNFTQTLTFASLVGTGMKFLSSYKKYQIGKLEFSNDANLSYLKRSMIISTCAFFIYLFAFAFELYMAGYVPLIMYQRYTYQTLITKSQFIVYSGLNTAANVLCILSFIIYVLDVNVDDVTVSKDDNNFNKLVTDPNETREETNPY